MVIDRNSLKNMRPLIDAALAELGQELGVKFEIGNARFSRTGDNATFKLEVATIGDDGEVKSKDVENFKKNCYKWGMKPTDLGETFLTYDRKEYKIIGANPRRWKNPILCESLKNGKTFIFPGDAVKAHLDRKRDAAEVNG